MDSACLTQLAAAIMDLGEHLRLVRESKIELLESLRETNEMEGELRIQLEEARRIFAELSARTDLNEPATLP